MSTPQTSTAQTYTDNQGNVITLYTNDINEVYLVLPDHSTRRIGQISNGIFITDRTYAKHLHRKSNSYGFNFFLIKHAKEHWGFDKVVIIENGTHLKPIPVDFIIKSANVMRFTEKSFELQYFLEHKLCLNPPAVMNTPKAQTELFATKNYTKLEEELATLQRELGTHRFAIIPGYIQDGYYLGVYDGKGKPAYEANGPAIADCVDKVKQQMSKTT